MAVPQNIVALVKLIRKPL